MSEFDEYIRQGEPESSQKARNWQTAIGLQAVDGLKPSKYLIETARLHIEGEIDIDTAKELLHSYYESKTRRTAQDNETEEADKVSANITQLLGTSTLSFNTNGYISVHRHIFDGVFKFAGQIRDYNITKKEWVLCGDTVSYLNHTDLRSALDYDIEQEKLFDYSGLQMPEVVQHIARFVSGLWQIHPFGEGNTRTTAVFTIQYLRSIGFNINNDLFEQHSWYFRNALVRANYKNAKKGIMYNFSFIELFLRNLLMNENNELKNRYMLINTKQVQDEHRTSTEQVRDKLSAESIEILRLINVLGTERLSVKQMMEALSLKGRDNFLKLYLSPAIKDGCVNSVYPDRPNHPRQQYFLTVKGVAIYNENRNTNI
ncbi:MAG: Fic family protein [Bacteroidales bacterium]|nr:Fic family protein [Bacteroidales bacterium]MDD2205066.1 Fic family protein [Bacteroidales bacterium]MDD3914297.1 Fic family protein [Bacteroidales bacterium]MDD4634360.1 Fic family protein [Bacteroidales bacterium]